MKGDEKTMMFFVFGLLFTLLIFIAIILPAFIRIAQGACWANVNSALGDLGTKFNTLRPGENTRVQMSLGNCVDKFMFANRNGIPGDVNCRFGSNSVMIVVPDLGNIVQQTEKDTKGVKTICQEILCGDDCISYISTGTRTLEGPTGTDSAADYCVVIERGSTSDYTIAVSRGACKAGSPGSSTPGVITPEGG